MNNIKYTVGIAVLVAVAVFSLLVALTRTDTKVFGSIQDGQGYYATTTAAGSRLIRTGPTMLGSIIVSSSTTGILTVKNATSTIDAASTTVVNFATLPANGTYTFDANLERGLSIELGAGFNGGYTITYK